MVVLQLGKVSCLLYIQLSSEVPRLTQLLSMVEYQQVPLSSRRQ
jgi:hypothetical protein